DYFYRAAYSILDVHKLGVAQPPVADFSWSPSEIYPGTPATFTDLPSGAPTTWTWTFSPDGTAASTTVQNPAGVVFGSQGPKLISLIATNGTGDSPVRSKPLTVLSPTPAVSS